MFYAKAAARCHGYLLLPRSESNQPREWKRMHGLLLGMRAALEGAAASTRAPLPAWAEAASGIASSSTRGEKNTSEQSGIATAREGGSGSSTGTGTETPKEAALALFAADVRVACEAVACLPSPPPPPPPTVSSSAPQCFPPQQTPLQARVASQEHDLATTTPHPPPPVAATGVDVAFRCLSHRQAAVREAAIGLLHAQARVLGPGAASALYRKTLRTLRTLRTLKRDQEEKDPPNEEVSTATPTAPAPEADSSDRGSVAGVGPERRRAGASRAPSRAEAGRARDRIGGLLGLLERIVDQGVLPRGTVGGSWECLFSVLR